MPRPRTYPNPSTLSRDALRQRIRRCQERIDAGSSTDADREWLRWATMPMGHGFGASVPRGARRPAQPQEEPVQDHVDEDVEVEDAFSGGGGGIPPRRAQFHEDHDDDGQGGDGADDGAGDADDVGYDGPTPPPFQTVLPEHWRELTAMQVNAEFHEMNRSLSEEKLMHMPLRLFQPITVDRDGKRYTMMPLFAWALADYMYQVMPDDRLNPRAIRNYVIGAGAGGTLACGVVGMFVRRRREKQSGRPVDEPAVEENHEQQQRPDERRADTAQERDEPGRRDEPREPDDDDGVDEPVYRPAPDQARARAAGGRGSAEAEGADLGYGA